MGRYHHFRALTTNKHRFMANQANGILFLTCQIPKDLSDLFLWLPLLIKGHQHLRILVEPDFPGGTSRCFLLLVNDALARTMLTNRAKEHLDKIWILW